MFFACLVRVAFELACDALDAWVCGELWILALRTSYLGWRDLETLIRACLNASILSMCYGKRDALLRRMICGRMILYHDFCQISIACQE
jgi:hypothetical protein